MPRRSLTTIVRQLAGLAASLACATCVAATPKGHAPPQLQLHYTMVTHKFSVTDYPGRDPDERSMARDVEWSYPVFNDTLDPATPALNAWARRQSLALLLRELHGEDLLGDDEVIAKAIANHDFIDEGVVQAVVTPDAALGRYRGVTAYGEAIGGSHPYHQLAPHLFSLDRRAEIEVASLFKPDDEDVLKDLFDAQPEAACPDATFDWAQASVSADDTVVFEYPYRPGRNLKDIACGLLAIQGPQVTRLLKSPSSLRPRHQLVEDSR